MTVRLLERKVSSACLGFSCICTRSCHSRAHTQLYFLERSSVHRRIEWKGQRVPTYSVHVHTRCTPLHRQRLQRSARLSRWANPRRRLHCCPELSGSTLGSVPSVGFDKRKMMRIHHRVSYRSVLLPPPSPCAPPVYPPPPASALGKPLETTELSTVHTVLSFLEDHKAGIIDYVAFSDGLFYLNYMPLIPPCLFVTQ